MSSLRTARAGILKSSGDLVACKQRPQRYEILWYALCTCFDSTLMVHSISVTCIGHTFIELHGRQGKLFSHAGHHQAAYTALMCIRQQADGHAVNAVEGVEHMAEHDIT